MAQGRFPTTRLRRNRTADWNRRLVAETRLGIDDLIWPIFVHDGPEERVEVGSFPGVYRLTVPRLVDEVGEAEALGIPMVAVFPVTDPALKTPDGDEAVNPDNLVCRAVAAIKDAVPDIGVMCDVALDPFTSHGHDGLLRDGVIVNDETIEVLCRQAVVQADAGCDVIAPSDMMDGRVGAIRRALDEAGYRGPSHPFLRRQIRLRPVRAVPRCGGLRSQPRRRRQEDLSDGSRQLGRGVAGGRARHRGGRGHGDGQARPLLSRHRPTG